MAVTSNFAGWLKRRALDGYAMFSVVTSAVEGFELGFAFGRIEAGGYVSDNGTWLQLETPDAWSLPHVALEIAPTLVQIMQTRYTSNTEEDV